MTQNYTLSVLLEIFPSNSALMDKCIIVAIMPTSIVIFSAIIFNFSLRVVFNIKALLRHP